MEYVLIQQKQNHPRHKIKKKSWYWGIPRVLKHFVGEEIARHTLWPTLKNSIEAKELRFSGPETLSNLLERQASTSGHRPFIYFENQIYNFAQANKAANQICHWLERLGAKGGDGLGIMLENGPEFLLSYFATQRLGMCVVPINTELKGDGLSYLIGHSEIKCLLIDAKFLDVFLSLESEFKNLTHVLIVNPPESDLPKIPYKVAYFKDAYEESTERLPSWKPKSEDLSTIMYTSGTTGRPKGVTFYYNNTWVRRLGLFANLIFTPDDTLYTCLPLFHANALFLTLSAGLWMGLPIVLSKKFSATKFWAEVNKHEATVFSAIGAMIPILLKAPPSEEDANNSIRLVLSAACPASGWEEFERRFDLTIWEGYSAVDGGQNFIYNLGNAPVGSIGKPMGIEYKILLEDGSEAAPRTPGELVFKMKDKKRAVDYFKDQNASNEKMRNGLLYTGDLVYKDENGFLYFVGRKTESMRRRGENVSAFDVENTLSLHPDILECAVYGVPSSLAEEDIMTAITSVENRKIDPKELEKWLKKNLASYAIPRYYRFMEELPKTATHKIQKNILKQEGVTTDTIDLQGEGKR